MKKFRFKNYLIFTVALLIVVAGGVYWSVKTGGTPSFGVFTVGRGNVVESVDQSGTIMAENNVTLSFQEAGQIAAVNIKEGSFVSAGSALAVLDQSMLKTAGEQASAALASAEAKLDGLTSGTRPEQLQIDNAAVSNAEASLQATLGSAYTAADDAVRNQVDALFSTPDYNPTFLIPGVDSQTVTDLQSTRQTVGGSLKDWYAATTATSSDASVLAKTADSTLRQIGNYLNMVSLAANQAVLSLSFPSATLSQYKVSIAAARNEITGTVTALTQSESALINAQNKLLLDQAGATPQDIEAQKAAVAQAEASLSSSQVGMHNAVLVAPFAGVVQNLAAKAGQVVTPGMPALTLVNNGGLKIDVYVSESDIAKITNGEKANVTVDALGPGTVLPAVVTAVGTTQTPVNGTPAYKVTLHFVKTDRRLKDGMSANVHIVVAEHDNVLEIPSRLTVTDNASDFVLIKNETAASRQKIQLGITGNDGMAEIVSGLSAGDKILNF
jgi:HlyD family secretion protein